MPEPLRLESPSLRLHKRQRVWQILVPFSVLSALLIVAAVLLVTLRPAQTRVAADISTIWILAPLLVLALLAVGLLAALIYGLARIMLVLPGLTTRLQDFVFRLESGARRAADGAVRPVIWIRQVAAALALILSLGSRR
jgi:hypothetical protein